MKLKDDGITEIINGINKSKRDASELNFSLKVTVKCNTDVFK